MQPLTFESLNNKLSSCIELTTFNANIPLFETVFFCQLLLNACRVTFYNFNGLISVLFLIWQIPG